MSTWVNCPECSKELNIKIEGNLNGEREIDQWTPCTACHRDVWVEIKTSSKKEDPQRDAKE